MYKHKERRKEHLVNPNIFGRLRALAQLEIAKVLLNTTEPEGQDSADDKTNGRHDLVIIILSLSSGLRQA